MQFPKPYRWAHIEYGMGSTMDVKMLHWVDGQVAAHCSPDRRPSTFGIVIYVGSYAELIGIVAKSVDVRGGDRDQGLSYRFNAVDVTKVVREGDE